MEVHGQRRVPDEGCGQWASGHEVLQEHGFAFAAEFVGYRRGCRQGKIHRCAGQYKIEFIGI